MAPPTALRIGSSVPVLVGWRRLPLAQALDKSTWWRGGILMIQRLEDLSCTPMRSLSDGRLLESR